MKRRKYTNEYRKEVKKKRKNESKRKTNAIGGDANE